MPVAFARDVGDNPHRGSLVPSYLRSATAMADQPHRHLLVSSHLIGNATKRGSFHASPPGGVGASLPDRSAFRQTPDATALETLYLAFDSWHGVTHEIWPFGGIFRGVRSLPCHLGGQIDAAARWLPCIPTLR